MGAQYVHQSTRCFHPLFLTLFAMYAQRDATFEL